jgi:hypothetical protein
MSGTDRVAARSAGLEELAGLATIDEAPQPLTRKLIEMSRDKK